MDLNWQLSGVNMNESSMRLNSTENRTVVRHGNILEASSSMWDQVSGSENLGFSNVHHNESSPNVMVDNRLGSLGTLRDGFDSINGLVWGSPNEVLKGGSFFSGSGGSFLPQSLPHFAADSGFIERAARYSCFSGGNLGAILSPFNGTETSNSDLAPMQRSQEPFGQTGSHQIFEENVQKNELNMPESSNRVCLSANELKVTDGSVLKNENSDGLGRSNNEAIMRIDDLNPDSEEAGFSGQGDPVESEGVVRDSSIGVELKKRKRIVQDSELDRGTGFTEHQTQAAEGQKPIGKKGKRNPDCKQGTQASDSSPKEDYIHVRARRGQATNSHSLAERVRREKISERMKFLQDLVPGCNKVTGKAVMLDEIINYVQSLQRQVEFLSMKLATVNPQLDCNLERLLAEDILQLRAGPSSSLPFQTEMPMGLQYHQSQGISQTIIQGLGNNTENALRRSMDLSLTTTRGGYREEPSSSSHINTTWGDELHNAIQMGLISTAPLNSHDITDSLQTGHTKDDI